MRKSGILIFIFMLLFATSSKSRIINLDWVQEKAKGNYPNMKQLKLQEQIGALKISNLSSNYYPEITLVGQAQYQSDVTKINLNIPIPGVPEIPSPSKDQYKIGININQPIWDGGTTSALKSLESAQTKLNRQNIVVDVYSLKSKINDIYFGILNVQSKIKILREALKDISEKHKLLNVKIENGAVLESNGLALEAEMLKLNQNLLDLNTSRQAFVEMLEQWTGEKIAEGDEFEVPQIDISAIKGNRPETDAFQSAKTALEQNKKIIDTKNYPKFSAYLQAMYGKPGLNMFENEFQPYAVAGIRMSWLIWNWNNSPREKEIMQLQKEIVSTQEESFNRGISVQKVRLLADIEKQNETIANDTKIIELRERILKTYSLQLENGVITSSEYLTEFTSLIQAKLNMEAHIIETEQAKSNLKVLLGE